MLSCRLRHFQCRISDLNFFLTPRLIPANRAFARTHAAFRSAEPSNEERSASRRKHSPANDDDDEASVRNQGRIFGGILRVAELPQGQRRRIAEGNGLLKRRRWRGITMRIRTRCQQCQNTTVPSYGLAQLGSAQLGSAQLGSSVRKRAIQRRAHLLRRRDLKILHLGERDSPGKRADRIPRRIITGVVRGFFGKLNSWPRTRRRGWEEAAPFPDLRGR